MFFISWRWKEMRSEAPGSQEASRELWRHRLPSSVVGTEIRAALGNGTEIAFPFLGPGRLWNPSWAPQGHPENVLGYAWGRSHLQGSPCSPLPGQGCLQRPVTTAPGFVQSRLGTPFLCFLGGPRLQAIWACLSEGCCIFTYRLCTQNYTVWGALLCLCYKIA